MNLKVKIAIGAAILVAVIALIVIDQTSGSPDKDKNKDKEAADDSKTSIFAQPSKKTARRRTRGSSKITEKVFKDPSSRKGGRERVRSTPPRKKDPKPERKSEKLTIRKEGTSRKPESRIKGHERPAVKSGDNRIKALDIRGREFEEYKVQPGDTLSDIAKRKYGNQNLWNVIAEANPSIRPTALRVGQKIKIPSKPISTRKSTIIGSEGSGRTYIVQPGDTLGDISKKVYATVRHADRIYEANRDKLASPHMLRVGMKIRIPDLPKREEKADTVRPIEKDEELLGSNVHRVKAGDNLWKLAERYQGDRGILEMIDLIVRANPRRLKTSTTTLRVGWRLIIPN